MAVNVNTKSDAVSVGNSRQEEKEEEEESSRYLCVDCRYLYTQIYWNIKC